MAFYHHHYHQTTWQRWDDALLHLHRGSVPTLWTLSC